MVGNGGRDGEDGGRDGIRDADGRYGFRDGEDSERCGGREGDGVVVGIVAEMEEMVVGMVAERWR